VSKELQDERCELKRLRTVHPADDWTEEDGDVLWWHFPICEPPIVGSHQGMGTSDRYGKPTDCRRLQESGWLTHWSPIPRVWREEDGEPLFT
jgi:hypothetical protein